jgi:hypothetical protein
MTKREHTVLVLQGGGALGAYQAGVYEGIAETGLAPSWVAGVSIGAINAALIAGNPPGRRVERLREFWNRVSSSMPPIAPVQLDPLRISLNRFSAATAATFGVPGFFVPRQPPALLAPDGTPEALSVYDTSPLKETLHAGAVNSCGSSAREIEHSHAVDDLACLQPCAMGNRTAHIVEPRLPKLSHRRPREFDILRVRRTGETPVDQVRDGDVALVCGTWLEQLVLVIGIVVHRGRQLAQQTADRKPQAFPRTTLRFGNCLLQTTIRRSTCFKEC